MIRKYITKSFSKCKASNSFLLTYKLALKRQAHEMKAVRKSSHSHTRLGGVEKSNREDFLTADEDSRLTWTDTQTQHPSELLGTRQKEAAPLLWDQRLPPTHNKTKGLIPSVNTQHISKQTSRGAGLWLSFCPHKVDS